MPDLLTLLPNQPFWKTFLGGSRGYSPEPSHRQAFQVQVDVVSLLSDLEETEIFSVVFWWV